MKRSSQEMSATTVADTTTPPDPSLFLEMQYTKKTWVKSRWLEGGHTRCSVLGVINRKASQQAMVTRRHFSSRTLVRLLFHSCGLAKDPI